MTEGRKKGSFIKQAAILAAAGILVRVLGFAYRVPLTNMIGDQGNAIYSAGYYIYTFLLILSSAGLPAAISKMVSERRALGQYGNAHRVFRVSLTVSTVLGGIFAVLMFLFAAEISSWANSPESYYCILTLSPTLLIVAIMSAYRGYFQGMNTMVPTAFSQIIEQIFNAVFSVYLAWILLGVGVADGQKNIPLGAAGGTAGTGIGALAGLITIMVWHLHSRKELKREAKTEAAGIPKESFGELAKTLFATAWPIIAGTAVFSLTNLIDMNMVTRLLEFGGYSHTMAQELYGQLSGKYVTLTTLPVSISTAVATAAIPTIAASMKLKQMDQVERKMGLTLRLSMLISVPAAVGIGALGKPIIQMLFPKASDGGILLTVGAVSIIFLAFVQTSTGVLQGIGHIKVPVVGAILGAIAKIIFNILLVPIPALNVVGAVLSTTACYAAAGIFDIVMLTRITQTQFDYKSCLVKPIAASCVMGAAVLAVYALLMMLCHNNTVSTLLAICVGVVVYAAAILAMHGVAEEDVLALPMGRRIADVLKKYHWL